MKDDNLPPDNETVEDGGGCYVAGSREEIINTHYQDDSMKEQDAAHSFDKFEGHTPGPWKIITRKPIGVMRDIYTISPNGRFEYNICEVTNSLGVNTEANANLIAAAPDLLAELTRLRSELQQAKQEIANHAWTKIDGTNYPLNKLLIVWNGTYNFAHFNTAYNKWVGQGHETTDTRNLMQFPPTHFMDIPEQPKQS